MSQNDSSSGHVKAAVIAGICTIIAACIGGGFLLVNTLLEKGDIISQPPTPTPTEAVAVPAPMATSVPPTNTPPSVSPTITYGFEDGTLQGWQSWDQREVLTIQNLTVTEAVSFSGQYALQVDVKGLSGSQGATIYLDQVTSLQQMFSAKLRLPPDAPADVEVWVQLAAASVGFEESPTPIYLSRNNWRTIVWNTSSYGWIDDSVRAIFIEMGAGAVEYTGAIYIDEIQIK